MAQFSQFNADDVFFSYQMFKPPGSDSRWVPIGYFTWNWTASISRVAGLYVINSASGPDPQDPTPTIDEPQWNASTNGNNIWLF